MERCEVKSIFAFFQKMDWRWIGILILGLGVRFWGINFGLPYTYAPDEPTYLITMLQIMKSGDLNPHWWLYPSLMFYLNVVALLAYWLVGHLMGVFATTADLPMPEVVTMGVGKLSMPSEFLVTRGLTAFAGSVAIVLVYLIARRLDSNKWVALLAAALFAISPTVVDHSHRIGPDIFALLFALLSYFFTMQILEEPKMRYYAFAGIAAGLAIASKYNAGLVLLPLILVHFMRFGFSGLRHASLYAGLGTSVLAFFAATPFALLDFSHFWEGVRFQSYSYTTEGHAGQEGEALTWYASYLWQVEGPMAVVGTAGALVALLTRSKKYILLSCFPVIYFLFVSQFLIRNARTIMLIVPFLDILAAFLVVAASKWLIDFLRFPRQVVVLAALVVSGLMIVIPFQTALAGDLRLTQMDSRESARVWLESNLPHGARIALEAYTPYIDTRAHTVQGVDSIIDHEPDWYSQNGFEYLLFSQAVYGRFFQDPVHYGELAAKYNSFFSKFREIRRFNDNNEEIRILETSVAIPSQRVAARFGNYGEVIELVGYNSLPRASDGSLALKLYWRPVAHLPEPLELETRLIADDDKEISKVRGDLFEGKGWQNQMFDTLWSVPVPKHAAGSYRIQLTLVQTRFSYNLPAKTWVGDGIDPLLLGPFEIK